MGFRERIEVVDVLRGFALLGILYAHMTVWHTGGALPAFVYDKYDGTASLLTMAVFGTLVFGKFFSLFAFLFGLSFHIMKESKPPKIFKVWFAKRLVVLAIIGFVHHAIWRGDILLIYALLGFLLMLLANLTPRVLFGVAVFLVLGIPNLLYDVILINHDASQVSLPMQEQAQRYYYMLKNGSFGEMVFDNITIVGSKFSFQFSSGRLPTTLGFFLLGAWFGKVNGLSEFFASTPTLHKVFRWTGVSCLVLLSIGFGFVFSGRLTLPDLRFDPSLGWLLSWLFNCFNAFLTVWYIAAIALIHRKEMFRRVLHPLSYPGRMALSGYIFQTFIGLALYYPFALGLFDLVPPWINALMVFPVFLIQICLSKWWLTYFSHGPLERLWAKMTALSWFGRNVKPLRA